MTLKLQCCSLVVNIWLPEKFQNCDKVVLEWWMSLAQDSTSRRHSQWLVSSLTYNLRPLCVLLVFSANFKMYILDPTKPLMVIFYEWIKPKFEARSSLRLISANLWPTEPLQFRLWFRPVETVQYISIFASYSILETSLAMHLICTLVQKNSVKQKQNKLSRSEFFLQKDRICF